VFTERTSVGLDVHARSVAAAAIDGVTGELFQARLTPSHDHLRSWLADLPGPVAVAYEAGPTGFGLYRSLSAAGIRCEVAAPSKLQRPAGNRVKTDAKDAVHLARLLRLDEVTSVVIPTVEQEAARDLVRHITGLLDDAQDAAARRGRHRTVTLERTRHRHGGNACQSSDIGHFNAAHHRSGLWLLWASPDSLAPNVALLAGSRHRCYR